MAQQPIPFVPAQASGVEELAGASPLAVNVVIDEAGAVRRRPGIVALANPAQVDADGITALHVTSTGKVYAVGGTADARTLYRLIGGTATSLSVSPTGYLKGTGRPFIAETEAMLAIAGGSDIQRIYLTGDVSDRLSADAPLASHVIANNSRLLANNATTDRGRINYSDNAAGSATAGHESWAIATDSTAGFFEAEARPDPAIALHENTNEVFVFGATSVQVYAPDGQFVYSPVSTREYGLIAPGAVVKSDGQFFWMDHLRRIVRSDGRSFEVISDPIKRSLDAIADVSDGFAYRVVIGSVDAVCFCFPGDDRTFVYQAGGWCLWMGWDTVTNNFKRLPVNAVALDPTQGTVLVGTTDGYAGQMDMAAYTDLGEPINVNVTTGYLSRGTDARKHCRCVRLAFRRGETLTATEPTVMLSWRDDGGAWSASMTVGLGASGDYDPVVELRSLGTYRRRQWRLEFQGTEEFVLVSATEEFDFLAG